MSIRLNTLESVPAVCRMLRTKTAFAGYSGGETEPWQTGASTTAAYWCLCTMQTAGPDDTLAHPDVCHAGRRCYQASE